MAVTVSEAALHTALTTVAAATAELKLPTLTPADVATLIARASGSAVDFCHRPFARAVYAETVRGYGGTYLMLARAPVVQVASLLLDGTTVSDYSVEDSEAGLLYRKQGWDWTAQLGWVLSDHVIPRSEDPTYSAAYTAGWLVPDDDVVDADNLSAAAADNSFNDAASRFPLLVPGDRFTAGGFATASNNRVWTVVSRTASKIVVSPAGSVVTDAVGANPNEVKTLAFRNLPYPVEQAVLETIKVLAFGRARDPRISAKSVGGLSISYSGVPGGVEPIPVTAAKLLQPYVLTSFGVA